MLSAGVGCYFKGCRFLANLFEMTILEENSSSEFTRNFFEFIKEIVWKIRDENICCNSPPIKSSDIVNSSEEKI